MKCRSLYNTDWGFIGKLSYNDDHNVLVISRCIHRCFTPIDVHFSLIIILEFLYLIK